MNLTFRMLQHTSSEVTATKIYLPKLQLNLNTKALMKPDLKKLTQNPTKSREDSLITYLHKRDGIIDDETLHKIPWFHTWCTLWSTQGT